MEQSRSTSSQGRKKKQDENLILFGFAAAADIKLNISLKGQPCQDKPAGTLLG